MLFDPVGTKNSTFEDINIIFMDKIDFNKITENLKNTRHFYLIFNKTFKKIFFNLSRV